MAAVVCMAAVLGEAAIGAAREPVAAIPLPQLAVYGHHAPEPIGRSQELRTVVGVGGPVLASTPGEALGALAPVTVHQSHASYVGAASAVVAW
jgi:hypothetical protein